MKKTDPAASAAVSTSMARTALYPAFLTFRADIAPRATPTMKSALKNPNISNT